MTDDTQEVAWRVFQKRFELGGLYVSRAESMGIGQRDTWSGRYRRRSNAPLYKTLD
jgi:hypothetical protein